MRSEWNAPKGKLGQCKNIIIFSRLSFEDRCFHLLFSSSFLHNHALCRLPAVLLAINTTFVVFVGCLHVSVSHVQCQGLSFLSRFRYSHTLCICHCFSSIWLFTFRRVTFHTWACKCSIRQYHRQSDHCFTPTCAFTVRSAQCTTLLINFLCAMCK